MLQLLTRFAMISIVGISFMSCSKTNSDEPVLPGGSGIYAAYSTGPQYNERKARIWHDGVEQLLSDSGSNVYVNDIAIANNGDVYTTGCECWRSLSPFQVQLTDSCRLILWKNNQKQLLSSVDFTGLTKARINISKDGDRYIAGTETLGTAGNGIIRLWKNGVKQDITNGSSDAMAYCLQVSGNDVYIGGEQKASSAGGPTKAVLWKNGSPQVLTDGSLSSTVVAVQVAGPDVYLAVNEGNASAWVKKNNVLQTLPAGIKSIQDMVLTGNDLYVLASPAFSSTAVYKNGLLLHGLTYAPGAASDIYGQKLFIKDGDVYVAGRVTVSAGETGIIWKNGAVLNTLGNSYVTSAEALLVR